MSPTAVPTLLSLLGVAEFTLDKGMRLPRYKRARSLLFLLAAQPERAFSREALCEMLWPDESRESARANLRRMLHHLRDTLDIDPALPLLRVQGESIQLEAEAYSRTDLRQFAQLCETPESGSASDLALAESLYRGEFLADWDDATPQFDRWLHEQRTLWHTRAHALFDRIAENCAARGEITTAVHAAERAALLDLANGHSLRTLLKLLATAGRGIEVEAWFQRHKRYLHDEVGAQPEAATTACHKELRERLARNGDSAEKHAAALLQAAQHSLQRWDYSGALALCNEAESLLGNEPDSRAALIRGELEILKALIAERNATQHTSPLAAGVVSKVLTLVPESLFLLRFASWASIEATQGPIPAEHAARQLQVLARRCGEWAKRRAEIALILPLFWQGKFAEAAARSQSIALPSFHAPDVIERHGGGSIDVMTFSLQAWSLLFCGEEDSAVFAMERALAAARLRGEAMSLANSLATAANIARWRDRPHEALALSDELISMKGHGAPEILVAHGHLLRIWALHQEGCDNDVDEQQIALALNTIQRNNPAMEAVARSIIADALHTSGCAAEVKAALEAAITAGERYGHSHCLAELQRRSAEWHHIHGSTDSAMHHLTLAEELATSQGNRWVLPRIQATRTRLTSAPA